MAFLIRTKFVKQSEFDTPCKSLKEKKITSKKETLENLKLTCQIMRSVKTLHPLGIESREKSSATGIKMTLRIFFLAAYNVTAE